MPWGAAIRKTWLESPRKRVQPDVTPSAEAPTTDTITPEIQAVAAEVANEIKTALAEADAPTQEQNDMATLTADEQRTLDLLLKKQGTPAPAPTTTTPTAEELDAARKAEYQRIYRLKANQMQPADFQFLRDYIQTGLNEALGQ